MKLPAYFHHIYTSDTDKTVKHSNVGGFSHRLHLSSRIFQAGVPGRPGQAHGQGPAGGETVPADQRTQIQRKTPRRRICLSLSSSFVSPNQTWRLHVPLVSLLMFWVHLRPPLPPPSVRPHKRSTMLAAAAGGGGAGRPRWTAAGQWTAYANAVSPHLSADFVSAADKPAVVASENAAALATAAFRRLRAAAGTAFQPHKSFQPDAASACRR